MSARLAGWIVAGLTALGAVLRFATLDRQSFWSDEAVTVLLTRMELGDLLSTIADTESTPPLYYVLAWLWAHAFGDGEVGLRSLSALCGTASIPVAALAGRLLAGRRAGIAAAALVAVSPPLVWYAQEARAYALAVLLCGASFAALARARQAPAGRVLAAWAALSVLALGTHYFAAFVVAAQVAWLLSWHRRASVWGAVAVVAAGGVALLPLALRQRGNGFAEFVGAAEGLAERLVVVPKQLLVGHALPAEHALAALAALLVGASVAVALARGGADRRRGILVALTVGGSAFVLSAALAVAGLDYLNARNALVGAVPLAVAAGAGLVVAWPRRVGAVATAGLCVLLGSVTIAVAADPSYHRPDWRGLARDLGNPAGPRVLVVAPDHQGWFARVPLQLYLPDARAVDSGLVAAPPQFASIVRRPQDRETPARVVAGEVVLAGAGWEVPELPSSLAPSFRLVEERHAAGRTSRLYRSARPVAVAPAELALPTSAVLLQSQGGP